MFDVFLSYARADLKRVEHFVQHLETHGLSVFWDKRIPGGEKWPKYLKQRLDDSHVVVVLWTNYSVESDWVELEAREGLSQAKLVPVLLDKVEPPWQFSAVQCLDLTQWTPRKKSFLGPLVSDILRLKAGSKQSPESSPGKTPSPLLERAILDEVGSYGTQLGWIYGVLATLIPLLPHESMTLYQSESVRNFLQKLSEIEQVRRRYGLLEQEVHDA